MSNLRVNLHELAGMDAAARAALMRRADADLGPILDRAAAIVEAVRTEGDVALRRFARELDGVTGELGPLVATEADFDAAYRAVAPEVIEAIRYAVGNIRKFHEKQRPEPMWLEEIRPGAFAGDRWGPIPSVALYVPRGKGAFPSVTTETETPITCAGGSESTGVPLASSE